MGGKLLPRLLTGIKGEDIYECAESDYLYGFTKTVYADKNYYPLQP